MSKTILKFLLVALAFLFLVTYFSDSVFSFFSQDDFFHLRIIMNKQFGDIPQFFVTFKNEYSFYRPLSREVFNLLMLKLFGFNSLVFHIVNLTLIILNGLLAFLLMRKNKISKVGLIMGSLIYFFSSVHSIELYYLASVQTLLSTLFVMLSLINFLSFSNDFKKKNIVLSVFFYALSVFCHESATILPAIFLLWIVIYTKRKRRVFVILIPYLFIALMRVFIFLLSKGLDTQQSYLPVFSLGSMLNTFSWFTLWCFGLPEMLVDFMTFKLQFNPNLFKYYSWYTNIVFPAFSGMLLIIFGVLVKYRKSFDKNLIFYPLSFVISLIPFLFFPQHKFVYYLSLPLIFFSITLTQILAKSWNLNKILTFLFLVLYLIVSYQTLKINKITYWAAKRANSAEAILRDIKIRYPQVSSGTKFYITDDPNYPVIAKEWGSSSQQAFYILSGSDAFELIYNDPNIKVYYQAFDEKKVDLSAKDLIIYRAEFPY